MNNSSLENESLDQDSLFMMNTNHEEHQASAKGNALRATLLKTPAAQMATTTSSQFRTYQPNALGEDSVGTSINIRESNLVKRNSLLPSGVGVQSSIEGSGPLAAACTRTLKPSQRNKVIMTRSVDHQD